MQKRSLLLSLITVFALGCSSEESGGGTQGTGAAGSICTPGDSKACTGPAGCQGGQACLADGTGWGSCDCGTGGASSGGAGGGAGAGGTGSGGTTSGGAGGGGGVAGGGGGGGGTGGATGGAGGTGAKTYKVGETAQQPEYSMKVTAVKTCTVPTYCTPAGGNIKLGVEVSVQATGSKTVPVNPFYAKVTDSQKVEYTSTFCGCTPELQSVSLQPGQSAGGWITFELPSVATGLMMSYNPFIVGSPGAVVFDLGM